MDNDIDSFDEISDDEDEETSKTSESVITSYCMANKCSVDTILAIVKDAHCAPKDIKSSSTPELILSLVSKANEKDPVLAAAFYDCTRDEVNSGVNDGTLRWISEDEFIADRYREYRPVVVFKTKLPYIQ